MEKTLEDAVRAAREIAEDPTESEDAKALATMVLRLDGYLSGGGQLPQRWALASPLARFRANVLTR